MPTSQEVSFRRLLSHVWEHSRFYREYYGSHGITEKNLPDVTVRDLPFVTKKTLMENFDAAVTDPRLRKRDLVDWIRGNPDPRQNLLKDFIVIHSSGSSGDLAIFVYDQTAWRVANGVLASHLPPPNDPLGKIRVAFYLATHGHFATVSAAVRMPAALYDVLPLSVLAPTDDVVRQLNSFQPNQLGGYSSSVTRLAELTLQGKLHIHPQRIFVSGDKLTPLMERTIQAAWKAPVYVFYGASESACLALKSPDRQEMTVLDELNIIEVLAENDQPVLPGALGRVTVTNLYNRTLPILRYELGDDVVPGRVQPDGSCTTIRDIIGRVNDALPVVLQDGRQDSIHPLVLPIYVPGLEKIQFVSKRPNRVQIDYVAESDLDAAIRDEFQQILDWKSATQTSFIVRRVPQITHDPKTGKFRLIRIEVAEHENSFRITAPQMPDTVSAKCGGPVNPFIPFDRGEVEQSIQARFEQMVLLYPNRLAIKSKNHELTYSDLNKHANRIARAVLAQRGEVVEPVALLFEHDAPAIAASLGVLKTGKMFVPLNPSLPKGRIVAMIGDLQAGLIVTDSRNFSVAKKLCQDEVQLINVDELGFSFSDENMGLSISPDACAYILYTSGSTGQPKGVVHNQRNVLHFAMEYTNGLHICASDRLSLLYSISVMGGAQDMFSALLNGASLYPFDIKEEGFTHLASWLIQQGITIYHSVPTVFRSLLTVVNIEQEFPSLRLIKLIGEPVSNKDVELFKKHFPPGCIFVNVLSSTETGAVTCYFVDRSTAIPGAMLPVGYSVEDKEVLLLDDEGRRVGDSQIGEITVKSRYMSLGYWRRPDLTQHVFSADPENHDRRIYRTGNMGRMLPDGCLEHLGRKDFQVKIRGHRIEIEEIEVRLLDHPAVTAAVVVVGEEQSGQCLTAYWVPSGDSVPMVSELRSFLRERLPDYMVPSFFLKVEALPLLPSGKIDRKALPVPAQRQPELEEVHVAPRSPEEEKIARIWGEVLKLDKVGVNDNFFDLGGHSLLATQIISKMVESLHVELSVRFFFEAATVAGLANFIETIRRTTKEQQRSIENEEERERGDL